ncbi:MAG: hypothetical protein OXE84_05450 [Rhodobacteraceae bacterium]|nr:hypothetical protein [Paracoccaceae bacterium]MCY4195554.1 hypothetical protein [Paracoccaceae bacterium]MCY4326448.1 hypothetical protein [Paracoccaceae bacterium]
MALRTERQQMLSKVRIGGDVATFAQPMSAPSGDSRLRNYRNIFYYQSTLSA